METNVVSNRGKAGQGLVEYALILLVIAVICVTAVAYFGEQTANTIPSIDNSMEASPEKGEG